MAISDDTAALVAAHLTVAWAKRVEGKPLDPSNGPVEQVFDAYEQFRAKVKTPPKPIDYSKV